MKVEIVDHRDKSDPHIGRHSMTVTDGEKKFVYETDWNRDHDKSLNEAVGKALDDLIYHDGAKGRVRD